MWAWAIVFVIRNLTSPTRDVVLYFVNKFVSAKKQALATGNQNCSGGMEGEPKRRRRELEPTVLHKVGDVVCAINEAKHVDQIISALHSLAVRLFPLDSSAFSGPNIFCSLCLYSEKTVDKNRILNSEIASCSVLIK